MAGSVLASLLEQLSGKRLVDVRGNAVSGVDDLNDLRICFAFMQHENVPLLSFVQPQGSRRWDDCGHFH